MPARITVTEASRRFSDLINRVFYRNESTVLLKGGKPVAQIVPIGRRAKTGHELAAIWKIAEPKSHDGAEWAEDVDAGRAGLEIPRDPWA